MKKVTILRKIHVTMKSFALPFSTIERSQIYSCFSYRYITCSIRIGILYWGKCGHYKNEEREIYCLCCREADAMLIALAKIPERE